MTDNYLYIFFHLPKTGGSTIRKHIEKNFNENERLLLRYTDLRFNPYRLSRSSVLSAAKKSIEDLSKKKRNQIKVIYGEELPYGIHKLFDRPARYITVVRNPIKRTISLYNFHRTRYERDMAVGNYMKHYSYQLLINGRVPSFSDWLNKKYGVKKYSTETIYQLFDTLGYFDKNNKTIVNALSKFYFIGVTEKSDSDFAYIYEMLRVDKFFIRQNVSSKFVSDKELVDLKKIIKQKNSNDIDIYKKALSTNKKFKTETKDFEYKVKKSNTKKSMLTPFTQLIYDPKELMINTSQFVKKKIRNLI